MTWKVSSVIWEDGVEVALEVGGPAVGGWVVGALERLHLAAVEQATAMARLGEVGLGEVSLIF